MKPYIYDNIPKSLDTVEDLTAFVESIPEERWCLDIWKDNDGRCCILGHIELAYGRAWSRTYPANLTVEDLAVANNGVEGPIANDSPRLPNADLSGAGIKARILELLSKLKGGV